MSDIYEALDTDDRVFSLTGIQRDIFFEGVLESVPGLRGVAACEIGRRPPRSRPGGRPARRSGDADAELKADVDRALRGAHALRRISELVERPAVDAPERDALVFGALVDLESIAALGGPTVLPWRARAHLLAFADPVGAGLARLDLMRARRTSPGISDGVAASHGFVQKVSEFFFVCAAVAAPNPDEGGRGAQPTRLPEYQGPSPSRLSLAWLRERAVYSACTDLAHGSSREVALDALEGELKSDGGEIRKPVYHGLTPLVEKMTAAQELDPTEADKKRVLGGPWVFQRIDK